jgi:hypothetical protein
MPRAQDDKDIDNLSPVAPVTHDADGYENPFDIIDSPWGHIERWRASTLSTGTMGALANVYDIVRSDSAAAAARADETEARNTLIQHLCAQVADFEHRFADHVARLAEAEDKRRADEAEARKFDEEPIDLPPDLREAGTGTSRRHRRCRGRRTRASRTDARRRIRDRRR